MLLHQILPAAMAYAKTLCDGIIAKKQIGLTCNAETALAQKLSIAADKCYEQAENLRIALEQVPADSADASVYYHDVIVSSMEALRKNADILEQLTDKNYWPYPTYSDLLYY